MMSTQDQDSKWYVESYQHFSRTLRTWLIAYGIGAPVLFTTQPTFTKVFKVPEQAKAIIFAFLIGVSIQIVAALIYKASMWYIMWGYLETNFRTTKRHIASEWLSTQLWLELLLDIVSIGAFAWATTKTLLLFSAS